MFLAERTSSNNKLGLHWLIVMQEGAINGGVLGSPVSSLFVGNYTRMRPSPLHAPPLQYVRLSCIYIAPFSLS